MTQAERASLERLEDKITDRLDGIAVTVNGIDTRLRKVEIDVGTMKGERQGGRTILNGGMQAAFLAAALGGVLVGLPSAVWYVVTGGPH